MSDRTPARFPRFSPLEPIFFAHAEAIPLAFREQFLHGIVIRHPLVGDFFGYTGTFRVERARRPDA